MIKVIRSTIFSVKVTGPKKKVQCLFFPFLVELRGHQTDEVEKKGTANMGRDPTSPFLSP